MKREASLSNNQRIGEFSVLACTLFGAIFPIVTSHATKSIPPLFFAGMSMLIGSIFLLPYVVATRATRELFSGRALFPIFMNALFNVVIAHSLIYTGAKLTSGISTAILLQTEVVATLIIFGLLFKEKITRERIIGAALIMLGATFVLYNGKPDLNVGNFLIMAGTLFYPFGNYFAKKAIAITKPAVLATVRSLIGGAILLSMSFFIELDFANTLGSIDQFLIPLALNGIGVFAISKIFWFEGIRHIDISHAVPIDYAGASVGVLYAMIFLREMPTFYQAIGIAVIIGGLLVLFRKGSRQLTEESSPSL